MTVLYTFEFWIDSEHWKLATRLIWIHSYKAMMSPSVESNDIINRNITTINSNSSLKKQVLCNTDDDFSLKSAHPISSRSSVFCIEQLLNNGKHVRSSHPIHDMTTNPFPELDKSDSKQSKLWLNYTKLLINKRQFLLYSISYQFIEFIRI